MATAPRKPSVKSSNNLYKKGKLSKDTRFSSKKVNFTPIIVLACVLATFIFAMIFGNILGEKAQNSQSTPPTVDNPSNLTPPSADKVKPYDKLHAYFADMTGADPEKSLSDQTSVARDRGNALLIEIKNSKNEIMYSSDKTEELGFKCQENLTLSRLANHFQYYNDFAVGVFKSDFSSNLDSETALKLQTNEILLLKEATDTAFDQIIIEFADGFTKDNLVYYQTYLLNLKLACDKTPVGIKISKSFLSDKDNAGGVAGLLNIADFFVLDLGDSSAEQIENALAPIIYFTERYNCIIVLSDTDETTLVNKILLLESKGIENYIIK